MDTYVHHYTSLETLALILEGKRIKLNSLRYVDDPEEIQSEGISDFGKFVYLSSWSDDNEEKIPLWKMYTDNKGVRISLPDNFIENDFSEISSVLNERKLDFANPCTAVNKIKVCYDLRDTGHPNVVEYDQDGDVMIALCNMARHKYDYWSFQSEVRYVIYASPKKWCNENDKVSLEIFESFNDLPDALYVKIKEESFKKMKIILGPETSAAQEFIVQALVDRYNPGDRIVKSSIKPNKK